MENDHISGNDHAYGCVLSDHMAENPFNGNRSEVEIYHIKRHDIVLMSVLTAVVTIPFYFILKAFNTANLIPSTISVTTSFLAVYLTFKRSPYYAAGYAANDLILIILWTMASMEDISCLSVTVCFAAFFVNDIYGFFKLAQDGTATGCGGCRQLKSCPPKGTASRLQSI